MLLRNVIPSRPGQLDDMLDHTVELHTSEGRMLFARPVEFPQARHSFSHVLDSTPYDGEVIARPLTQVRLALKERLRIHRHRRYRIVDIVGDAAGHLAERPETLILHGGLLSLPQVVVRSLQRAVELRVMGGKSDVFAQLA